MTDPIDPEYIPLEQFDTIRYAELWGIFITNICVRKHEKEGKIKRKKLGLIPSLCQHRTIRRIILVLRMLTVRTEKAALHRLRYGNHINL